MGAEFDGFLQDLDGFGRVFIDLVWICMDINRLLMIFFVIFAVFCRDGVRMDLDRFGGDLDGFGRIYIYIYMDGFGRETLIKMHLMRVYGGPNNLITPLRKSRACTVWV